MSRPNDRIDNDAPPKIPRMANGSNPTTPYYPEVSGAITTDPLDPTKPSETIELFIYSNETFRRVPGTINEPKSFADIADYVRQAISLQSFVIFDRHRSIFIDDETWLDSWSRYQSFRVYPSYLLRTVTLEWDPCTVPERYAQAKSAQYVRLYPPHCDIADIVPQLHTELISETFVSCMYIFVKMSHFKIEVEPDLWVNLQEIPVPHRTLRSCSGVNIRAVWPPECAVGNSPELQRRILTYPDGKCFGGYLEIPDEVWDLERALASTDQSQLEQPLGQRQRPIRTRFLTALVQLQTDNTKADSITTETKPVVENAEPKSDGPSSDMKGRSFAEYWREVTWKNAFAVDSKQPVVESMDSGLNETPQNPSVETTDPEVSDSQVRRSRLDQPMERLWLEDSFLADLEKEDSETGQVLGRFEFRSHSGYSFEQEAGLQTHLQERLDRGGVTGEIAPAPRPAAIETVPTQPSHESEDNNMANDITFETDSPNADELDKLNDFVYKMNRGAALLGLGFVGFCIFGIWILFFYDHVSEVSRAILKELAKKIFGWDL